MTNSPKKQPQPSNNPALDELTAIRKEISEFRNEIRQFRKRLWLDIGSGAAIAAIVLTILSSMINGIAQAQRKSAFDIQMEASERRLLESLCKINPDNARCK